MIQMGILALFNQKNSWQFKEIKEKIFCEGETVKQITEALRFFGFRSKLFNVIRKDTAKDDAKSKVPAPFDDED